MQKRPSLSRTNRRVSPGAALPRTGPAPRGMRLVRKGLDDLVIPLHTDLEYTFGRHEECSFVLPTSNASRRHATLQFDADTGTWTVRDLGSSNGTTLVRDGAGSNVGEALLQVGDLVQLGEAETRLVMLEAAPRETAPISDELESRLGALDGTDPVLLLGPTGAGKTYVARRIHELSGAKGDFILVNCGALPSDSSMLRAQLLGVVAGAYNDAQPRVGDFFAADGGTLFLDEVESLPEEAQRFLLAVIDTNARVDLSPLGASSALRAKTKAPRLRLVSASKLPLNRSGLRQDLGQRLGAGDVLKIKPLNERRGEIPSLCRVFLGQVAVEKQIDGRLDPAALELLVAHDWSQGNLRELEAVVKAAAKEVHRQTKERRPAPGHVTIREADVRAVLAARAEVFGDAAEASASAEPPKTSSRELTRDDVAKALEATGGVKNKAAARLGIAIRTLDAKMKKFDL